MVNYAPFDILTPLSGAPEVGAIDISPDGNLVAIAHNITPFLTVYKVDYDNLQLIKLPNPSVIPANRGRGVKFSPDGKMLVVVHTSAPRTQVYRVDGETLTHIGTVPLDYNLGSIVFTPDGTKLIVGGTAAAGAVNQTLKLFAVDGETFTELSPPETIPPLVSTFGILSVSPNSEILAVALPIEPYLMFYEITSNELINLPNPDPTIILGANATATGAFSSDGTIFNYTSQGGVDRPILRNYSVDYDNKTLIKITEIPAETANNGYTSAYVANMNELLISVGNTVGHARYSRSGNNYTLISDIPDTPQIGFGYAVAINELTGLVVFGRQQSPFINVFMYESGPEPEYTAFMGEELVIGMAVGNIPRLAAYVGTNKVFGS